ncbi:cation:dicarboxylate symporter family transporter [Streptomyces sp. AK08-02]|uniref:cation:dicarboxylate symporter family transporter n=1 Tax=Streptomyces sp. AK08-02 TaxID=3028654 RepID=UPI0029BF5535|nr:cation:dicarboxylase symporter family transporter [Streptomyces sp. AK08-02]MDX3748439.1 cation:dicarboxylase symporter family transporter [Streptomyces sp. AK08-02]
MYVQVLVAIVIGIVLGWRWPDLATDMEPIGTTFITAMKMLIGPIVFLTIIGGIAGVADLRKVGRTGIKALTYFQVGTGRCTRPADSTAGCFRSVQALTDLTDQDCANDSALSHLLAQCGRTLADRWIGHGGTETGR